MRRIVIVGGSVAGVQVAESLRARGYDGWLTLLEAGRELPYNRPPLSKELLTGELDEDDIRLLTPELVAELALDLRLDTPARGLDLTRRVVLTDVDEIAFDDLVIATGAAALMPRDWSGIPGVVALRTLDDARAVQKSFRSGNPRVVVIGGGFIGCELAAVAARRELDVTIVEVQPQLMGRALPADAAAPLLRAHLNAGVRVRFGLPVTLLHRTGPDGSGPVQQVELADGERLDADLVVVGIGARPETDWLTGSGIGVDDGVHTDETLRAGPGVYAVGDVARWQASSSRAGRRVEHWTNAREHAVVVAHNLLDPENLRAVSDLPYIWSDQYGRRLQIVGDALGEDLRFVTPDPVDNGFVALIGDGKRVIGAIGYGRERPFRKARRAVAEATCWEEIAGIAW